MKYTTPPPAPPYSAESVNMFSRACSLNSMVFGCQWPNGTAYLSLDSPLVWQVAQSFGLLHDNINFFPMQTNTFQGIVITNGYQSFTIFTYRCGSLQWSGDAVIGFKVNDELYEIHELSGNNGSSIACQNSPRTIWSNVVYQLCMPRYA